MSKRSTLLSIFYVLLVPQVSMPLKEQAQTKVPPENATCFEETVQQKVLGNITLFHIWRKNDMLRVDQFVNDKLLASTYITLGHKGLSWDHPWWARRSDNTAVADSLHAWLAFWHLVDVKGWEAIIKEYQLPTDFVHQLQMSNFPMTRQEVLASLQLEESTYSNPPYTPHFLSTTELKVLGQPIRTEVLQGIPCTVYQEEKPAGDSATEHTKIWVDAKTHLERGREDIFTPPPNSSLPPMRTGWKLLSLRFHHSLPDSYFQLPPGTIVYLTGIFQGLSLPPQVIVRQIPGLGIPKSFSAPPRNQHPVKP
jgi:hypothetical protein